MMILRAHNIKLLQTNLTFACCVTLCLLCDVIWAPPEWNTTSESPYDVIRVSGICRLVKIQSMAASTESRQF